MKIDGRAIADTILSELAQPLAVPTLAVIQVGDNEASSTYIEQKKLAAARIGARVIHTQFPQTVATEEIKQRIAHFNADRSIHGIILQRPLPQSALCNDVDPKKDVDGFVANSPYVPPVAAAVIEILKKLALAQEPVVVIGRGETAGKPIADTLTKRGWPVTVVHSQTPHQADIIRNAHIVISCVGKERIITRDIVNPQAILIGVGLWRDKTGKLRGDYEEDEIKDLVAYYTPTPGGVGPVNVACLMQNLVKACTINSGGTL